MARFEIVMPKLGESIIEATITRWLKNVGDTVKEDESILEIATDKVDSEIPSPVEGKLAERLFKEGDVIAIGTVIAVIEMEGEESPISEVSKAESPPAPVEPVKEKKVPALEKKVPVDVPEPIVKAEPEGSERFYSPLVRNIAKQENIPLKELEHITGSGVESRITKQDLLNYIATRGATTSSASKLPPSIENGVFSGEDQIIEMDRIRQLIAGHMVRSVQTSPHVTSFVEVDMTKIVEWRERHKEEFFKRQGLKLTFTPLFIEAIAKAVRDYPTMNVSVDGSKIIVHKNINVGMAVSLPNFNLIVPVIRNADQKKEKYARFLRPSPNNTARRR